MNWLELAKQFLTDITNKDPKIIGMILFFVLAFATLYWFFQLAK